MSESTPEATGLIEYVDPSQLRKDIAININQLSKDMEEHASRYVEYAIKAVRARRQHERYQLVLSVLEAQLDSQYRASLREENPKASENQIKAAIATDARTRAAKVKVIDSEQQFRIAEIAGRSFDQRKDMLLQLARDAAREGAGQLRVGVLPSGAAGRDSLLEKMKSRTEKAAV
jgi:hypothetical protein